VFANKTLYEKFQHRIVVVCCVLKRMKLEGIFFKTYLLDNYSTIADRIALQKGVLPKHLQFDPPLDESLRIHDETNVSVTNLLAPFIDQTTLTFPDADVPSGLSRLEAEELFIVYHKALQNSPVLLNYIQNLITPNPTDVWKQRNKTITSFKSALTALEQKVKVQLEEFEEFEKIPSAPLVPYEPSNVVFNVYCDTDTNLEELFNSVVTTQSVPYVNFNRFHKIVHNFQTNPERLDTETENAVLFKVDCGNLLSSSEDVAPSLLGSLCSAPAAPTTSGKVLVSRFYRRYTNAVAAIVQNKLFFTIEMKTGPKNVTREVFLNRLFEALPCLNLRSVLRIEEIATIGVVVYPSQVFLAPIWADFCMNTPLFSRLLVVDESLRASKKRQDLYMYVLNTPDTVKMLPKETEHAMMYTMSDEGTPYIKTKIKTRKYEDALRHQEMLAKLVTVYNRQFGSILDLYRTFIPSFMQEEEALMRARLKKLDGMDLRAIAPDIFFPNYSRKCLKKPTVVSEDEANRLIKTGREVMPFPIFGESRKRYYICEHPTHPYPGLRENQLENKKMFPYVPCCYIRNQDREGTRLRFYYNQAPVKEQQSAVQDIFLSGKILPAGMPGVLPDNIKQLFSAIDPDPENQFMRFGINKNNNAFLETVMLAINHSNLQYYDTTSRIALVAKQRDVLREHALPYAYAAKQELYDEPIPNIVNKLKTCNLRVVEFVRSIEQFFDCNIFVFASHEKNTTGSLIIPAHTQTYLKNTPNRQVVFVYEQERDNESHCELIVQNKANKPKTLQFMTTVFTPNDQVVKNLWQIFSDMNRSFNHNKVVLPLRVPYITGPAYGLSTFDLSRRALVTSQIIDIYGKARVLNISVGNTTVSVVCDPLPPYAAVKATQISRAPLSLISEVVDKLGAVVCEQRVSKGLVREVVATMTGERQEQTQLTETTENVANGCMFNKFVFVFLSSDPGRLQGVSEVYDAEQYDDLFSPKKTFVSYYTIYKRIAKIIYQQALFLFSTYIHQQQISLNTTGIDDRVLAVWANSNILIDPGLLQRSDVLEPPCLSNSRFNTPTPFVKPPKLIVPSREVLLRIVFMVRLYSKNNLSALLSFRNKKFMEGFYTEASDFTLHPNQFVLDSPDAVKGLINTYNTDMYITKTIRPEYTKPYFLYTSIIPDQVFIARNVLVKQDQRQDKRGRPKRVRWDFVLQHNQQGSVAVAERQKKQKLPPLKEEMASFLESVPPLQTAIYIVRFWNMFRYNPTSEELQHTVQDNKLTEGDVDVYSWVSFDTVTNLTNYTSPISGMIFAYKIDAQARYTALLPISPHNQASNL